jgi:hypothetical protein
MSTRDSKTPFKKRLKDLFRGRSVASPAPSTTQPTGMLQSDARAYSSQVIAAVQPPKPEYVAHRTRAPPSIATDPPTPPSDSLVADAPATRASTGGGANDVQEPTAASPLEIGFKPPEEHGTEDPASATIVNAQTTRDSTDKGDRNAQEPATASLHEKSSNPPDEHGPKEPTFDTSHRLWNAAYDDLEKDEAELVGSSRDHEYPLCSRCYNLDLSQTRHSEHLHESFIPLGKRSLWASECHICQIFSRLSGEDKDSENLYLIAFSTQQVMIRNPVFPRLVDAPVPSISFGICDSLKEVEYSAIEKNGWMTPLPDPRRNTVLNARKLDSQIDIGLIRSWLDSCSANHIETCSIIDSRPTEGVQVIDCRARTILPLVLGTPYLALSYLWGANAGVEKQKGSGQLPESLPRTIEDAMLVTLALGYQYLWIDRYCIDQENEQEKMSQIWIMDRIYSNSEATIFAAAGSDPHYGLPGASLGSRPSSRLAKFRGKELVVVPPSPKYVLSVSRWNERAWTYQEALLSRRRIIFLEQQVLFQCTGMICCESIQMPFEKLRYSMAGHTTGGCNNLEIFPTILPEKLYYTESPGEPMRIFARLISSYSLRSLTDPRDRLNAFLGVVQRFRTLHPSFRHISGLGLYPFKFMAPNPSYREQVIGGRRYSTYAGDQTRTKYLHRETTRTEQFLSALSWTCHPVTRCKEPFPSWSWVGWYNCRPSWDNWIKPICNTSKVKIYMQQGTEYLNIDKFLHITVKEQHLTSHVQHMLIDAPVCSIKLISNSPHPALTFVDDSSMGIESFYSPTQQQLQTEACIVIFLGEQLNFDLNFERGSYSSGSPRKTLVLLVVNEKLPGIAERFGILKIKGAREVDEMRKRLKHRRTLRID